MNERRPGVELSAEHEALPAVQLVRALGSKAWERAAALVSDDLVYEIVLSKEVIRGKADWLEFNRTYPGDWEMPIDEVVHEGSTKVVRLRFISETQYDHAIIFFETRDGLVIRQSDWWPESYAPPDWRSGQYDAGIAKSGTNRSNLR